MEAEDVDLLRIIRLSASVFLTHPHTVGHSHTHKSTPPSPHVLLRQLALHRPHPSVRENDICGTPKCLRHLLKEVFRVGFLRNIGLNSQELRLRRRARVQRFERLDRFVQLLFASAAENNALGAGAGPDVSDRLRRIGSESVNVRGKAGGERVKMVKLLDFTYCSDPGSAACDYHDFALGYGFVFLAFGLEDVGHFAVDCWCELEGEGVG